MLYIFFNHFDKNLCAGEVLKQMKRRDCVQVIQAGELWQYKSQKVRYLLHLAFWLGIPLDMNFSKGLIEKIKAIQEEDKVLIFGGGIGIPPCMCLPFLHLCATKNLYMWIWDSIIEDLHKKYIRFHKKHFAIYTFDKNDAKTYGLQYKNTVAKKSLIQDADVQNIDTQDVETKTDVYFVGIDRNRYKTVNKIYEDFVSLGLVCDFSLIEDATSKNTACGVLKYSSKRLSFEENIKKLSHTKAVLDVAVQGQQGLTQRGIQALFMKKKVITTNIFIEEEPFYNSCNVFIYGKDDIEKLPDFLNSDFVDTEEQLKDYEIDNWIRDFL